MTAMMRITWMVVAFTLALGPAGWAQDASKDAPSSDDVKAAEAAFKKGRAWFEQGDMDRAIAEYKKANELAPHPVNLFNLGLAYRAKGDKRTALEHFQKYLNDAPKSSRTEEASTYITELIKAIEEEDAEKARQEAERKRIEAEKTAAERQRAAAEAERRRLAAEAERERQIKATRPLRWGGIGTAAVGLASLGLGIYYGLQAKSIESDINDARVQWPDDILDKWDEGESAEKNMVIFTSVGAAATIAGGVLWYIGHRRTQVTERDIALVPSAGQDTASLTLIGRF